MYPRSFMNQDIHRSKYNIYKVRDHSKLCPGFFRRRLYFISSDASLWFILSRTQCRHLLKRWLLTSWILCIYVHTYMSLRLVGHYCATSHGCHMRTYVLWRQSFLYTILKYWYRVLGKYCLFGRLINYSGIRIFYKKNRLVLWPTRAVRMQT